ncbi:MAG: indolepyruvate oxidoreductase subunit beta [Candidatus Omnitrophica bacterium]|nr:indolepyruvate oxidoreductase subunit beta [Candidatus Omnitrophota bacterium]
MDKDFNIVIVGTGGQGVITLLQILAEAAMIEGYDVKTSELHGLSQRGGSVEVHLKFGKKIFSPLVPQGGADLILSLEAQECLKSCYYAGKQTTFLINRFFIPILEQKPLSEKAIVKELEKFTKNIIVIPAADICEKKLGKNVVAGVYLLSYAVYNKIIPLKPSSLSRAIDIAVSKKYLELNKKTFELVRSKFSKKS